MKTLMVLSAVPASGKTTWAKNYQATHPNTYIVNSDEIRMEITGGDYQDHTQQDLVWKTFSERIHEYGKNPNCTVILDALNDLNLLREKYVKENPEFDRYILVLFPLNRERSIRLNSERPVEIRVPENILNILMDKFETPSAEIEGLYNEIAKVEW